MHDPKGFTLIEVLIALMIIAIAITACMHATNASIRVTRHVRDVTIAHWVAMNVISEIQVGLLQPVAFNPVLQGKTHMLNQTWDWTAVVMKNPSQIERIAVNVQLHHRFITSINGYAS